MANESTERAEVQKSKPPPRAGMPVTIIEEAVYWALVDSRGGLQAWAVVCSLNMLAHRQRSGRFTEPSAVVARRIGLKASDLTDAVTAIENACESCGVDPWIEAREGGGLILCVYEEWNPSRGGKREGAGRPPNSKDNQTDPLDLPLNNESESTGDELNRKRISPDTESDSSSNTSTSSESESEEPNAQHTEPVTEGHCAHLGQSPESDSVVAAQGGVDSGSTKRQRGLMSWAAATAILVGRHAGGRHKPDSEQWLADRTAVRSLFDDYVWPIDLMDDEAAARLATGLRFAALANKNARKPMAYLTKLCKRHITQPEMVFS